MFPRLVFGVISLICIVLTCMGQNATISSMTVTSLADRTMSPTRDPNANKVKVEAALSADSGVTIQPVVLRVSRLDGTANQTLDMTLVDGRYRVDSLAVPQGTVRYEVEAPFIAGATNETQTARRVIEQHSPVPDGCFFFDSPTPGWSGSTYKHWYGQNDQQACGPVTALVNQSGNNDGPERFSSSLWMSLDFALNEQGERTTGCFRDVLAANHAWDFTSADFVSPDLLNNKAWKNSTGFDVKAGADTEAKMQLLIKIRDDRTRLEKWYTEVDASGNKMFHDLSGFEAFGVSKPRVRGAIREIRIRIFLATYPVGFQEPLGVRIDRICPRH